MRHLLAALALCATSAHAGLQFDCTSPAFNACQTLTATLVDDVGPTDTYDVAVLGVTRRVTLLDSLWLEGGRYELAANTDDHTLDVIFAHVFDGYTLTYWVGHGAYFGDLKVLNFGHWGVVPDSRALPEPGTRALIALALGFAGIAMMRRKA